MLEVKDLVVKYSYKTVLNGVSLSFEEGKIYSLLGENGAGKSTLAHVLCGDILKTEGTIFFDDEQCDFHSPKDAIQKGICCVHQRPLLAQEISIAENLQLGIKKINREIEKKLAEYWLLGIPLNTKVKNLGMENQFFVSLTGALLKNPKVIILDEPPKLSNEQLQNLVNCVDENSMQNDKETSSPKKRIVIIITHDMHEAIEKTDFTVLLKDGKILKSCETEKTSTEEIENLLFGISEETVLPPFVIQANLDEEKFFSQRNSRLGYIPSDKTFRASNPNLTVKQLLCAKKTFLNEKQSNDFAQMILKKAEVKIRLEEKVSSLSGGMLQRVILEKELSENPKLLVLFKPLHGLDYEAIQKLYGKLESFTQKGGSVIMMTDCDELRGSI